MSLNVAVNLHVRGRKSTFFPPETVFEVVNQEHDKIEAKKKTKHQNSITGSK